MWNVGSSGTANGETLKAYRAILNCHAINSNRGCKNCNLATYFMDGKLSLWIFSRMIHIGISNYRHE